MIIIKVMGGLGNQMFQYSVYNILKERGYKVYLDLNWFDIYKSRLWLRPFKINDAFLKSESSISIQELKKLKVLESLPIRILRKFLPIQKLVMRRLGSKINYFKDFGPFAGTNLISEIDLSKSAYLNGYWANSENFIKQLEFLQNIFKFNLPKFEMFEKIVNEIRNCNSVSVHWRRGDYNPQSYLPQEYYIKALEKISEVMVIDKIFIFSDSLDEVKEIVSTWKTGTPLIFVADIISFQEDYLEMYLMTQTKANIIANSTFSWWAAFLNSNEIKTICYPQIDFFKYLSIKEWIPVEY